MDIFPTIADILDLPDTVMLEPLDGKTIFALLQGDEKPFEKPIPFRYRNAGALIDGNFKIYTDNRESEIYQLYNLQADPKESTNVAVEYPDVYEQMVSVYQQWDETVDNSIKGLDYPEKIVTDSSRDHTWMKDPRYEPYLDEWVKRWEYKDRIEPIQAK